MLIIPDTGKLRQQIEETYPEECCGFLIGTETGDSREVTRFYSCENKSSKQRTTFSISSIDYRKAEEYADSRNLRLLGIYHSHPDSPAAPSPTDLAWALPNFSYLIASVTKDGLTNMASWRLNATSAFENEVISH